MKLTRSTLLIAMLLSFPSVVVGAEFRQPDVTGGLGLVASIFGDARAVYRKIIVDPAVRAQSLHSLRVLSNRLEALALAKQEFTDELLATKWPGNQPRLYQSALDLEAEVGRTRRALSKFFEPLPDNLKKRSGEVERKLEGQFSGKWQSLKDISSELSLQDPSAEVLRRESKKMLDAIDQMRVEVDKLIAEIAQS